MIPEALPYITFIIGLFIGSLIGAWAYTQPRDERGRFTSTNKGKTND